MTAHARHFVARVAICAALPVALTLAGFHLAATSCFSRLEFGRAGFPADPYGFSTDVRVQWGDRVLRCVVTGNGLDTLAAATLPPGQMAPGRDPDVGNLAFSRREIGHLADVARLFGVVSRVWMASIAMLALALLSAHSLGGRPMVFELLRQASLLTLAVYALLFSTAVLGLNPLLDSLHESLFEGNSYLFYSTDTLVRLYPPQYWRDFLAGAGALGAVWAAALYATTRFVSHHRVE